MQRVKATVALSVGAAFAAAFGVGVDQASAIMNPSGTSVVEVTNPAFSGFNTWRINGVDHVFNTSYWIRLPGQSVRRIDDLDFVGQLGGADTDDFVTGLWRDSNAGVDVQVKLGGLSDGNPTQLPVGIKVSKTDPQGQTLNLQGVQVYEYSDLDLNQTAADDTLTVVGGNEVTQTDGLTEFQENSAQQPSHYTAGLKMSEANVQAMFAGDLNDTNSFPIAPDDGAFAFQWTFDLDTVAGSTGAGSADDSFDIGITKSIATAQPGGVIPEPATTMLGMAGISALGAYLSRRRRNA